MVHLAAIFRAYFLKLVEIVVTMSTSINLLNSCSAFSNNYHRVKLVFSLLLQKVTFPMKVYVKFSIGKPL